MRYIPKVTQKSIEENHKCFKERVLMFKKKGLEILEDALYDKILGEKIPTSENVLVTNIRHKEHLEKVLEALIRAQNVTGENFNAELLSSDLNIAIHNFGLITGEAIEDEVLDKIFSEFCIGK